MEGVGITALSAKEVSGLVNLCVRKKEKKTTSTWWSRGPHGPKNRSACQKTESRLSPFNWPTHNLGDVFYFFCLCGVRPGYLSNWLETCSMIPVE